MDERRRKILRNTYIVIGVSALLLIAMVAAWYLVLVRPQNDQIAEKTKQYEQRSAVAAELGKNLKARAKALEEQDYLNGELAFLRERYRSLDFSGSQDENWRRWMNEYYAEFGIAVRRELIAAANASGVIINSTIKVDAPPQVPENVQAPPSGFLKPTSANGGALGVEIRGTFPAIINFLNRINLSPILMVVGNIKLEGASPDIKATFTLTPYLLARGAEITASPAAAPSGNGPEGGEPGMPGDPGMPPEPEPAP